MFWRSRKNQPSRKKVPIRTNVLFLVGLGYASVIIIFLTLACKSGPGKGVIEAFDIIEGPLLALIGGSLAISKDLIPISDDEKSLSLAESGNEKENGETNKNTKEKEEE